MKKLFKEALEDSPIIAAVKDDEGLSRCLTSDSRIIFILYGDIVTISDIVETVKSAGKLAIVHLDLINGLSSKEVAVDLSLIHISEPTRQAEISYAVFCLKKKKTPKLEIKVELQNVDRIVGISTRGVT